MGSRWGIGRTPAQIQALLYLSPAPMHAADISAALSVARSNVSISLRELQLWGLVKLSSVLGDRKDHFESLNDPLDIAMAVMRERRRREFDPTLNMLRTAVQESETPIDNDETRARLSKMLKFFEEAAALHDALQRVPDGVAKRFIRGKGRWKDLLTP